MPFVLENPRRVFGARCRKLPIGGQHIGRLRTGVKVKERPWYGLPERRVGQCAWIVGEPGRRGSTQWCECTAVPDRPYCAAHCRLAYKPLDEAEP